MDSASEQSPIGFSHDLRRLALLVSAGLFMESLDGTIIGTALPHIARSFAVPTVELHIGMTAYLMAVAICIPLSNWIADYLGPRKTFTAAIAIFSLASLACAMSNDVFVFTLARIAQGIGGAFMVPVGRLVVLENSSKENLVQSIAYLTWPAMVAPLIAPPLGGVIAEFTSWRVIFLLNLPVGLVGMYFAYRFMPERTRATRSCFDLTGFILWALTAALTIVFLDGIGRTNLVQLGLTGMAAVLACLIMLRHMRCAAHPLLTLRLLSVPTFGMTQFSGSLFRTAIFANPFLLPVFFQVGLGMDAAKSGLLLFLGFIANFGMKFATTAIMRRFGFRNVLLVNTILTAAGFTVFAFVDASTSSVLITAMLLFSGMGRSLQFTALNTLAFSDIAPQDVGKANAVFGTIQQVNAAMGVALAAAALELTALFLGTQHDAVINFHIAFLAMALFFLGGLPGVLKLKKDAGAHVSGSILSRKPD